MEPQQLSAEQQSVVNAPLECKLFLVGPAGTGKTTAGVARLRHWLAEGVPGETVLVITPQRTLAGPYDAVRRDPNVGPGGVIEIATVGGIARRMIDLFWPLVVEEAGFAQPDARPAFLTLETAQYFMARIVDPLIEERGYFASITIDRNRLYSQILDNLNKAAVVGFPLTEIAPRLKAAWVGDEVQLRVYDEAQACAQRFRRYCLAHNLLDFSLQMDIFTHYLWPEPLCRDYLLSQYTHLLVDNVEEDTPVAHDLLADWLPHATSALIIYDEGGGHRVFLGADPRSGLALREACDERVRFTETFVMSPPVSTFGSALNWAIAREHGDLQRPKVGNREAASPENATPLPHPPSPVEAREARKALTYTVHRFYPQMLDWVTESVAGLIHDEGVPPGEIVVLAPFLPDVLRFSLAHRLEQLKVPARSHRPSRALRDEPATRTLLTFAALAHPDWGLCPPRYDVAYALMQAIDALDLVRAQLLAEILYRTRDGKPALAPFADVKPEMQQRITYVLGGRYEALRLWLAGYAADPVKELDHFLAGLFGEILSQPGFGFHDDFDAARVASNLIESVQKFRRIAPQREDGEEPLPWGEKSMGQEYVEMVDAGVVAAQYVRNWEVEVEDAVLLAPAYTFLMGNRPVDYQFWLNVGGRGWWERLYQPLTQPYVLSRRWDRTAQWTDADEVATRRETLDRLTQGLIRRCRKGIFLSFSELSEGGFEQRGPLLQAIQRVLRNLSKQKSS
ncbi:MAG: UvrD-helicase domain-containing protein [Anaerolineae bacterium]